MRSKIITIDGPAGSGKSTVARNLARKLAFVHLNSGGLFRAVGLEAVKQGVSLEDDDALTRLARSMSFEFGLNSDGSTFFLVNGKDWSSDLGTRQAGELATRIAVLPGVRGVLAEVQRETAKTYSLVLEGRDAGTVIFPDADFKFYLDAPLDVRAKRRLNELMAKDGGTVGATSAEGPTELTLFETIKREMAARDHRDSTRAVAPQVKAADAELVDTSEKTIEQVVGVLSQAIGRI